MSVVELVRVLLVAGRLSPRGRTGYALRLAEGLPSKHVAAELICLNAGHIHEDRRKALGIHELPTLEWPWWRTLFGRSLIEGWREGGVDVVHVTSPDVGPLGEWLSQELQLPLIYTAQDCEPLQAAWKFRPPHGGKIIAISQAVRKSYLERGVCSEDQIQLIYPGVSVDDGPRPAGPERHVPVVGTVGPLVPTQGLVVFLEACREVLKSGVDVEFLIAGQGPDEPLLRRLTRDMDLNAHVTFVTDLPDVVEALRAIDVYCMPSFQQGLGTLLLEVLSQGKPAVASSVGGIPEILEHEQNGLLVPPGSVEALSAAILRLLREPAFAKRLGTNGRERVRHHFPLHRMLLETAALYHQYWSRNPV